MSRNRDNIACPCQRCRLHRSTGGIVLITLGILFLVEQFTNLAFHRTWPVFLIVLGLLLFARTRASIEGHLGGGFGSCAQGRSIASYGATPGAPPTPGNPSGYSSSGSPAPAPFAGSSSAGSSSIASTSSSTEVDHG